MQSHIIVRARILMPAYSYKLGTRGARILRGPASSPWHQASRLPRQGLLIVSSGNADAAGCLITLADG